MLLSIAHWLQNTDLAQWIAQSSFAFPTIETCHVICFVTVVGTIAILDLRLLNLASTQRSVSEVSADVLPFTWVAFILAAITGGLLFTSKAVEYVVAFPFLMKMLLLVLAGANMMIFHFTANRSMGRWEMGDTPRAAKIAAGLSLTFWTLIIVCGRWIGFTVQ
jgi:hypothetical protein